jgi:hypothetical protein
MVIDYFDAAIKQEANVGMAGVMSLAKQSQSIGGPLSITLFQ